MAEADRRARQVYRQIAKKEEAVKRKMAAEAKRLEAEVAAKAKAEAEVRMPRTGSGLFSFVYLTSQLWYVFCVSVNVSDIQGLLRVRY